MIQFPDDQLYVAASDSDGIALDALDRITSPFSSETLKAGAFLSVLRAYDKKIDREKFSEILDKALRFWDQMARMRFTMAMQIILQESGAVDPQKIAEGHKMLLAKCENVRLALIEDMKKVAAIPPKGTTKH